MPNKVFFFQTDGAEENEYNLPPLYRDRSDLSEPIQRQLDAIGKSKKKKKMTIKEK